LHGEAVALGLLATCRVSHALGLCEAGLEGQVAGVLQAAGLDTDLDSWLRSEVLDRMGVDKKRTGSTVRFIVVAQPGDVRCHEMELSKLTGLLLRD
jgi:3-dehydroquinate synthetase